jgi:2-methylisocitrate lyase-like PEP mutase family enzyme
MMSQLNAARRLRELHENRPLVLPNAWDASSARLIEKCGALAIATTSAGVSWTHGRRDGQGLSREEMIRAIAQLVQSVNVPVTADVEGGYGAGTPDDVAETVRAVIAAGAVGVNLEDSPGTGEAALLTPESHAERIQGAREAASAIGGDLFINARTDVYLLQVGAPQERFENAVYRANLYRQAGADCLFVPGVVDGETIARLVKAIHGPINIMVSKGAPSIADLGALGVARVSVGSALAQVALAATQRAAEELLTAGTYRSFENAMTFAEANAMFSQ